MMPQDIQARGVASKRITYPYRDDAMRLWHAIEAYATEYVSLFYKSDKAVAEDISLQQWAEELVKRGGVGVDPAHPRARADFGDGPTDHPHEIRSIAYLVKVVTMVIFTASAQVSRMLY